MESPLPRRIEEVLIKENRGPPLICYFSIILNEISLICLKSNLDIEFTCKRSLKMNRQNKLLYTNSPRISIQQESRNSQLTDQITMKPLSLDTIIDSSIHRAASPNKSSLSVYNDQNSLDSSLKRKHSPLKSSLLQVPNHMDNFTSPNNEPTSNKTSSSTTPNTQHNDKTSGSKNHALSVSSLTDGMSTGLNYMQPSKQHAWNQTSPNKLMEQPAKCHTNNKSKSEIDDSTRYLRHLFQNKMSRCFNEKHSGTIDSNDGKHSFRDQISPNQIKVEANSSSNNMGNYKVIVTKTTKELLCCFGTCSVTLSSGVAPILNLEPWLYR